MLTLSRWAHRNPWKARLIIVFAHVLLITLCIRTGIWLKDSGCPVPASLIASGLFLYVSAVVFYPAHTGDQLLFYRKRRWMDFILLSGTALMLTGVASRPDYLLYSGSNPASGTVWIQPAKYHDSRAAEILSAREQHPVKLSRTEKRILKTEFKYQLGYFVSAKIRGDKQRAADAGLIILAIIGALGLFYLLAALTCSLSCNGQDGLAIVVALVGTTAILTGFFYLIRRAKKPKKSKMKEKVPEENE